MNSHQKDLDGGHAELNETNERVGSVMKGDTAMFEEELGHGQDSGARGAQQGKGRRGEEDIGREEKRGDLEDTARSIDGALEGSMGRRGSLGRNAEVRWANAA